MTEDRRPLTIKGVKYQVTPDQVRQAMRGAPAVEIPPGGWWAQVGRRRHPLKTVVSRTLGLPGRYFSLPHAQSFARHVGLPFGQEAGVYEPPRGGTQSG